jgi:hypothetical protein
MPRMSALRGRSGLSVVPVVLLVALAFVAGSAGSATAGALTKGTVKKIALKVVGMQAPTLSVKHAGTADSATRAATAATADKLGGQTAYELGVRPVVFTLPANTPYPTLQSWKLGVPAGTYLASFSGIIAGQSSSAAFAECQIWDQTEDDYLFDVDQNAVSPHTPSLSGSGVVTLKAADTVLFRCDADVAWKPAYDAHLTLTPVASTKAGTLTPVP